MATIETQLAYLRWLAAEDSAEQEWVRTLRAYYDGKHPVYLDARLKQFSGLNVRDSNYPFAHNLCDLVVSEAVGRLAVVGFAPVEANAEDMADAELAVEREQYRAEAKLAARVAMAWWDINNMDGQQGDLFEAVCRDGEAYVIVDWHPTEQRPRWTVNLAFDGTQGVKLHRDSNTGEPLFASKRWQTNSVLDRAQSGRTRMTLYWPDRVEKYISGTDTSSPFRNAGWEVYRDDPKEPWPIPWPYGQLAVTPFANPGGSDLSQIISLQDALNKSDIDLLAAQDMSGFPVYWATGVDAEVDFVTGAERTITIAPGRLMRFSNSQAAIGSIPPADLERMIAVSIYWLEAIAGTGSTPLHRLLTRGGQPPSGDSLEMQEAALVAKVERKQPALGNAFEQVIRLSVAMWNAMRPGEVLPLARLDTQWRDARSRSAKLAEAKKKAELGVPKEQLWAELGYSQAQIEQFKAARKEERAADANLGEILLQSYEQGATAGQEVGA